MLTLFLVIFVCTALYLWYRYLIRVYEFWKRRNVAGPDPVFPFGNFIEIAKRTSSFGTLIDKAYFLYPEENFIGLYQGRSPMLVVKDPEDIKQVLIKDFVYFRNRNLNLNNDETSENIFHAPDDKWKLLRQRLTPIFSSGKVRGMFPLMRDCVEKFHHYLNHLAGKGDEVEMRTVMANFTIQFFSSCVLGIPVESINDEDNIFKTMARRAFKPSRLRLVCSTIDSIFPGIIKKLNIPQTDGPFADFFHTLVSQTVKEREGKPVIRKDFMDLLIELKQQGHITGQGFDKNVVDVEITEKLMTAQVIAFYSAGFETSSGTTGFMMYEMALNPDMQERVYNEICSVTEKYNGLLTYEGIQEMKYLEMVMSETLRKYSVASVLIRNTESTYKFPGTKVTIDKGTKIVIPVSALHKDPKYFPDPEKFDPERFSDENIGNIPQCVYVPFGEGPRHCIAARFAKTQTMIGAAGLLQKFKVVPSSSTRIPLRFSPIARTLQSMDGIWLKVVAR